MSKCTIREFMGDWALDIEPFDGHKVTLYFNSRRNAETVKRCIEVDDSVPNAATAVDFVEVVRCKDCEHYKPQAKVARRNGKANYCCRTAAIKTAPNDFCSFGRRRKMIKEMGYEEKAD